MKVFIKEDISSYGNFNDSIGKIYDCILEECINYDEQQYKEIKFENDILSQTNDVIFITINNERIEYNAIQDKIVLFDNEIELAHYLIDRNKCFAANIVSIYNMFK
ncbi:hypothetical protein H9L25_00730 [Terrisporobacter mayombei]|nr:hypothetical protein [Terrisporobacter mayombei]